MSAQTILKDTEDRMKKTLEVLQHSLASVRTGRANIGMVEHIKVDYYGTMTPIKQMANISIPDPRMIVLAPWDAQALRAIEKAINDSDLGISPMIDGKQVRLSIPPLTRERREELVKVVHKIAEEARVSMRSIRRDANEKIKQMEKEKTVTQDESFKSQDAIQKLTDRHIQLIDQAQASKETDLTQH